MRYRKGKTDIIGYLFLWGITITFTVVITLSLLAADGIGMADLGAEVELESESQNHHSMMGTLIYGELARTEGLEDYGDKTFEEVLSLYLSSDEDLSVNGQRIDKEEVREDLETYFDNRRSSTFASQVMGYRLDILAENDPESFGDVDSEETQIATHQLKLENGTATLILVQGGR